MSLLNARHYTKYFTCVLLIEFPFRIYEVDIILPIV